CRRIAGNTDYATWSTRDWNKERDCRVVAFETQEKAAEMQAWIDQSGIAFRPVPKFGQTKEEPAALREASIKWGFASGAVRRVVQAYRRQMFESGEGSAVQCAASATVMRHRPPDGEPLAVAMFLVEWAKEHHHDWFYGHRRALLAETLNEESD